MKITKLKSSGDVEETTVAEAVEFTIINSDFGESGALESLQFQLKTASEIIALLAGVLDRHGLLIATDFRWKLHYRFEVKEE